MTLRPLVLSLALAAAPVAASASGCASAPERDPGAATPAERAEAARPDAPRSDGPFVYVANQGAASVSVIDVDAHVEVARVDLQALGFGSNARPHDTAVEPDGSAWYVALIGENRVLKFDRDNRLIGQVEMEVPGLAVVHPDEDLLLVGRSMSAVNPPTSVAFVDREEMTLLEEVEVVFPRPHALVVRSDDWAYSASLAENRLAAIQLDQRDVNLVDVPDPAATMAADTAGEHTDHAGHTPHTLVEFAVSPDGTTMVAGGEISGELLVFDVSQPSIPRVVERVRLGGAPWHPAFAPDGRRVYVPLNRADAVAVVDASTWEVVGRVEGEGLAEPHGAAVSADGRWVFVSNNNTRGTYTPKGDDPEAGTVVVIDAATLEIVEVIEVGAHAAGLDTPPPARRAY